MTAYAVVTIALAVGVILVVSFGIIAVIELWQGRNKDD